MLVEGASHLDGGQLLDEASALLQLPRPASAGMQTEHLRGILPWHALDKFPAA